MATLADVVMPYFLFMVGASMAMSMRKYAGTALLWKVIWRTVKLFVLGCVTQGADIFLGGEGVNLHTMRLPGILQRIAWAYLVVALMAMYLPKWGAKGVEWGSATSLWPKGGGHTTLFKFYIFHWLVALSFFAVYVCIMLFWTVPSWSYVVDARDSDMKCNITGTTKTCTYTHHPAVSHTIKCDIKGIDTKPFLGPECSATRAVDEYLIGFSHMYGGGEFSRRPECSSCSPGKCPCSKEHPCPGGADGGANAAVWCGGQLDPEGILSSVPTVLTTWIGMHYGNVLVAMSSHRQRLLHWTIMSSVLLVLGFIIDGLGIYPGWRMNKQTWSPSYLFFMAGCAGFSLSFMYCVFDLRIVNSAAVRGFQTASRGFFTPMRWVGLNTIFIYLFAPSGDVFYDIQRWVYIDNDERWNAVDTFHNYVMCKDPSPILSMKQPWTYEHNTLICHGGIFDGVKQKWVEVVWTLMRIAAWTLAAAWLHLIRWYWAL